MNWSERMSSSAINTCGSSSTIRMLAFSAGAVSVSTNAVRCPVVALTLMIPRGQIHGPVLGAPKRARPVNVTELFQGARREGGREYPEFGSSIAPGPTESWQARSNESGGFLHRAEVTSHAC